MNLKFKFKFAKKEWIWWSKSAENPNTKTYHIFSIQFKNNEIKGRRSVDLYFLPIHVYVYWFRKKVVQDEDF